jgi:hypothetical protein
MSLVKNISGGPLDVPLLGRVVEDGETVEVPDFQPGSTDENPLPVVWPDNRWQPVKPPKVKPEPAAKDTSSKADG